MKLNGFGKITVLILVLGLAVGLYRVFGGARVQLMLARGPAPHNATNPGTADPVTLTGKIGARRQVCSKTRKLPKFFPTGTV